LEWMEKHGIGLEESRKKEGKKLRNRGGEKQGKGEERNRE
jgi:hypothetical protein